MPARLKHIAPFFMENECKRKRLRLSLVPGKKQPLMTDSHQAGALHDTNPSAVKDPPS